MSVCVSLWVTCAERRKWKVGYHLATNKDTFHTAVSSESSSTPMTLMSRYPLEAVVTTAGSQGSSANTDSGWLIGDSDSGDALAELETDSGRSTMVMPDSRYPVAAISEQWEPGSTG